MCRAERRYIFYCNFYSFLQKGTENIYLGEGCLDFRLELPHLLGDVDRVLVEHKLHEVGVLEDEDLHEREVGLGWVWGVGGLDDNIKEAVRVSSVALVSLDHPGERIHEEPVSAKILLVSCLWSVEGHILQQVMNHISLSIGVGGNNL